MQHSFLLLTIFILGFRAKSQEFQQKFGTQDIVNFWRAYENISSTEDSALQYNYLQEFYINKGTSGLKNLREARNYTERDYIDAINNYPKFWKAIEKNLMNVEALIPSIDTDIKKLKQFYPKLKPATIWFSIGAFRTPGTAYNNQVLIGAELSLGDKNTPTEELPPRLKNYYKEYSPRKNIALLCTHEYVHTQQKQMVYNLLCQSLYEGVAEFISCKATGKKSNSPAINFGKANTEKVIAQFVEDLYLMDRESNWLWGQNRNDLKVSDLGYFIGYEISERYYNSSENKTTAVTELIELDYTNDKEVERIVNASKLLPKTLQQIHENYENKRPYVISLSPFKNGSDSVKPGLTKITVTFSEPLNAHNTGIDFGPLGELHCPQISNRSWSTDGSSWSFDTQLEAGKRYQILISNNFRKENGVRLKSYLIDFKTRE